MVNVKREKTGQKSPSTTLVRVYLCCCRAKYERGIILHRSAISSKPSWSRKAVGWLLSNLVFWGPSKIIYETRRLGKEQRQHASLCINEKNKQGGRRSPFPVPIRSVAIRSEWSVLARYYEWAAMSFPFPAFGLLRVVQKTKKSKLRIACCFEVRSPHDPVVRKSNKQKKTLAIPFLSPL